MATLDTIELGTNGFWENEFEGSKVENSQKWTTAGRLFNFQKKKLKHKTIKFNCTWLNYSIVQQLEQLRDSGAVVVFTHNDSRAFNVILETIDAQPVAGDARTSYPPDYQFETVLTMIEL
jgi:hypothetical protein